MRVESAQRNRPQHRSLSRLRRATALLGWRTIRHAYRHFMLALVMAVVAVATTPASADTVRPGPVVVLSQGEITIPVPAPPSNADPMNPASPGDVVTQRYNNLRTGTTLHGSLDQRAVSDGKFGLIGKLEVDGAVLAQPLFVAGVDFPQKGRRPAVFIATSTNRVYAFDADPPFEKLWETSLGEPFTITNPHENGKGKCPELMMSTEQNDKETPEKKVKVIGIESTPVIDPVRQLIFVSYRKMDGIPDGAQRIAALDLRTGQFAKAADGHDLDRRVTDNPLWNQVHRNRASLLLDGGYVYVAFSGRCEDPSSPFFKAHSYQGWVYAFETGALAFAGRYRSTQQLVGAPPGDPTGELISGGGIWQGSTGLAADGHGNLFFATGNNDPKKGGPQPPDALGKNLSDSIVRLRIGKGPSPKAISMTPTDWFTPYRKTWLDKIDMDLGSSGVVLIPNTRYLVAGGKEGVLYVLDRNNLGKFDNGTPFCDSTVLDGFHTSGDSVGLDDAGRDQVVQKFRGGESQYCAAGPNPIFCLDKGKNYPPQPSPPGRGVTMQDWPPWPHIHGTPVFGAFPDGRAFLYLWAEKDQLKSFRWWGKRFEVAPAVATNEQGEKVLAPPYLGDQPLTGGMPGGMLALSIDPAQPAGGVLFASVQRCRVDDKEKFNECSVTRCHPSKNCKEQFFGMLRAFNPITLRELWNNQIDKFAPRPEDKDYWFAKFVPPTIAHGRVFLATNSERVLVYGRH